MIEGDVDTMGSYQLTRQDTHTLRDGRDRRRHAAEECISLLHFNHAENTCLVNDESVC
jgi:hypothetical protein